MQPTATAISALPTAGKPRPLSRGSQGALDELSRVNFDRAVEANNQTDAARHAANQLVASAFLKPLLAQVHKSAFQSELFHGGAGESMFQEHLDTIIADRIAQRTNFSLADEIYRRVARLPRAAAESSPLHSMPGPSAKLNTHG